MADNGSVAPKERVNIVYESSTGDAAEEKELPFKLLMVGDYSGKNDSTPLEDRKAINVDKDNFDEVLKAQNVNVTMGVPNKLEDDAEGDIAVDLKIESMKDFTPEAVAQQVPELKALLDLREALSALKGPLGNVPAFRKKIQELVTDEDARNKLLAELGGGQE